MPFNAPSEAIATVLRRLAIDPATRFSDDDQDPEYTACRADELPLYFRLNSDTDIKPKERAVLCCFMLEGLNELLQNGSPHSLQNEILDSLIAINEHVEELAYWMDTSDPEQENWWPITAPLLLRRQVIDSLRRD